MDQTIRLISSQLADTRGTREWQPFLCTLQGSTPEYGALNFSNNAPSWEDLQRMAEQQAKELNWNRPDLEQARLCSMPSDVSLESNASLGTIQHCIAWPGDMMFRYYTSLF